MKIQSGVTLPRLPEKPEDLKTWANGIHGTFNQTVSAITKRLNEMIIEGPAASLPAATGSRRFYFATDTSKLYYDGGTWVILN